MARLLRKANIPNGTLEPATARFIIKVVEWSVVTGTHLGRSHMLLSLTIIAIEGLILYITL